MLAGRSLGWLRCPSSTRHRAAAPALIFGDGWTPTDTATDPQERGSTTPTGVKMVSRTQKRPRCSAGAFERFWRLPLQAATRAYDVVARGDFAPVRVSVPSQRPISTSMAPRNGTNQVGSTRYTVAATSSLAGEIPATFSVPNQTKGVSS